MTEKQAVEKSVLWLIKYNHRRLKIHAIVDNM
jgi:hypothetical protein